MPLHRSSTFQRWHAQFLILAFIAVLSTVMPGTIRATTHGYTALASCSATIAFGETVQCSIGAGQVHAYTFTANAGDVVLARAGVVTGDLRPVLRIRSASGTTTCSTSPATGTLVELSSCTVSTNGTYMIDVSDSTAHGFGTYGLYLQRLNNPGNARTSAVGQTTTGGIQVAGQAAAYTITGNAGTHLIARMGIANGDLRPLLRLYRANGTKVCEGVNYLGGAGELSHCVLGETGRYTLLVSDASAGRTGTYGLHIQQLPNPVNTTELPFAQPVVAALLSAGEIDAYTVKVDTSVPMLLRAGVVSGDVRPHLRVYGTDGTVLCSGSSSLGEVAEISSCVLSRAGTYTVLVSDNGDSRTGTYGLYLQRLHEPVNAIQLIAGSLTSGTIATAGEAKTYTFTVSANTIVTARSGTSSGMLRPRLLVFNNRGNKMCEASTSVGDMAEISTCMLNEGGTYTLFVSDASSGRTGSFALHLQRLNNPTNARFLSSGYTGESSIGTAGEMDTYLFTANGGDSIQVRATVPGGTLRPHLRIYTDTGAKLCEVGQTYSTAVETTCAIPQTGRFVVLVNDNGSARTGNYTLFYENLTSPSPPYVPQLFVPLALR